ncbi:hypothetical protein MVES1_002407 [Malassezia vespertilionis]|uniref:Uncharacterized protein n=1 Tax=Malassezia vespertilionis TaxID=2020962 RepID=A0A2N1JBJ0_9BASI|nr:uncharacterized protein MVES1_002407 [Malassezia vespertilionis]PKI83914.1 hypothetical protein MVES_002275 [Malassezia vespertilionis]WFD07051.1 hypothetical protein MVES1_002407 [Malassezia vespertilionis]
MDQGAFRQLLAAGARPPQGARQKRDTNTGQNSRRKHAPRALGEKVGSAVEAMKPRSVQQTSGYMDRAEMRRRGIDVPIDLVMPCEASDMEHTAGDPVGVQSCALAPEEETAAQARGLDFSLLERQKARIAEVHAPDVDLDAALAEGVRTKLAEEPMEANALPSKFQPVAQHAEPDAAPDVIYVNGKRMRKKKKCAAQENGMRTAAATAAPTPSPAPDPTPVMDRSKISPPSAPDSTPVVDHSKISPPSAPDSTPTSVPPQRLPADDDIFDDADEWKGISDDETPEDEMHPTAHTIKPDWFATHPTEKSPSPAPPLSPPRSPSPSPEPSRLEGLSTSALPSELSHWLLEREQKRADRPHDHPPPRRKRPRSKKNRDMDSP